mmetsp:Transcript_78154/g.216949  ORF Transcript_78154/g.216949 Transcript_78154/m.216949 type:complete len:351 (-) Transcript_78154:19-1071(-)
MVHGGDAAGQQPLVGRARDEEHALGGVGLEVLREHRCVEPGPAAEDHAAEAGALQRAHREAHGLRGHHHGAPAHVHRRLARVQEGLEPPPRLRPAKGAVLRAPVALPSHHQEARDLVRGALPGLQPRELWRPVDEGRVLRRPPRSEAQVRERGLRREEGPEHHGHSQGARDAASALVRQRRRVEEVRAEGLHGLLLLLRGLRHLRRLLLELLREEGAEVSRGDAPQELRALVVCAAAPRGCRDLQPEGPHEVQVVHVRGQEHMGALRLQPRAQGHEGLDVSTGAVGHDRHLLPRQAGDKALRGVRRHAVTTRGWSREARKMQQRGARHVQRCRHDVCARARRPGQRLNRA